MTPVGACSSAHRPGLLASTSVIRLRLVVRVSRMQITSNRPIRLIRTVAESRKIAQAFRKEVLPTPCGCCLSRTRTPRAQKYRLFRGKKKFGFRSYSMDVRAVCEWNSCTSRTVPALPSRCAASSSQLREVARDELRLGASKRRDRPLLGIWLGRTSGAPPTVLQLAFTNAPMGPGSLAGIPPGTSGSVRARSGRNEARPLSRDATTGSGATSACRASCRNEARPLSRDATGHSQSPAATPQRCNEARPLSRDATYLHLTPEPKKRRLQ
jgi:hypothetical protein